MWGNGIHYLGGDLNVELKGISTFVLEDSGLERSYLSILLYFVH